VLWPAGTKTRSKAARMLTGKCTSPAAAGRVRGQFPDMS
jgi:hypothetical protein